MEPETSSAVPRLHSTGPVRQAALLFAALGGEARVRIIRRLVSARPKGLVVSEIRNGLGIPDSAPLHHLEKLRIRGLVAARRDRQYPWYTAEQSAARGLLGFLFRERRARNHEVEAREVMSVCQQ